MRKWIIFLFVTIIGASSLAVASAHTPHSLFYPTNSPQESLSNGDMKDWLHELGGKGYEIKKIDAIPKIDESEAIKRAKELCGSEYSGQAKNITAVYGQFTDHIGGMDTPPLRMPGSDLIVQDIPVWIVRFHGVNVLRIGPGLMVDSRGAHIAPNVERYVFADLNVVIDANSGEAIEAFAYNCAPEH